MLFYILWTECYFAASCKRSGQKWSSFVKVGEVSLKDLQGLLDGHKELLYTL